MERARTDAPLHDDRRTARRIVCAGLLIALLGGAAQNVAGSGTAPNLRLEWRPAGPAASAQEAEPIEGVEGRTVEVRYRLRNVGGGDAFAVVLTATTALGRVEAPRRLQPGPDAGRSVDLALRLPLARGMRELCIEARLQNLEPQDPGDPNPRDNRICRTVRIVQPGAGSQRGPVAAADASFRRPTPTTTGPHPAAERP